MMDRNIYRFSLIGVIVGLLAGGTAGTQTAAAQSMYEQSTAFLRLGTGASFYRGDLGSYNEDKSQYGYPVLAGELGYQFSPSFSALIGYNAADYPRAGKPGFRYGKEEWEDGFVESRTPVYTTTWRYTGYLQLQYTFAPAARFSPYIRLGAHGTHGGQMTGYAGINENSMGPSGGFGGILTVSDRVGLFIGVNAAAAFPDYAIDGFTDETISDDRQYDVVGTVGLGVHWRLTSSFIPVQNIRIHGPPELQVGEEGYFAADYSNEPTKPLAYEWTFGDGTRSRGQMVRHRYAREDTFEVTLTVSNTRSSQTVSQTVAVRRGSTQPTASAQPDTVENVPVFDPSPPDTSNASESVPVAPEARSGCREALETAESQYHQQRFAAAVESLHACMREDVPSEMRVQSYRLISLAHLTRGSYGEAREAVLKLLGIDPTYLPNSVQDPPNYVSLVNIVRHQLGLQ